MWQSSCSHVRSPLHAPILTNRQNSCKLFRTLNRALLAKYLQLKNQFQRFTPPNYEILSTFKSWKIRFTMIIDSELNKLKHELALHVSCPQEEVIAAMVDRHKTCQEFNELLKNLNSSIETIKDYIRTLSIKDPATEIYIT